MSHDTKNLIEGGLHRLAEEVDRLKRALEIDDVHLAVGASAGVVQQSERVSRLVRQWRHDVVMGDSKR